MPLPPAPTQRASRLSRKAMDELASASSEIETADATPEALPEAPAAKSATGRSRKSATTAVAQPLAPVAALAAPAVATSHAAPVKSLSRARKGRSSGPSKLFVLDTNVLMHDPMSLFRFEEHDVFLPMIVLEELDGHKKGMTEVARNARQASRSLDSLAAAQGSDMGQGLPLSATGFTEANGKLFFQTQPLDLKLPMALPQGKADNQILGVVSALGQLHKPREVVLVSKDINMRVKARAMGLQAEDYQNDKALEDGDLLYSGALALPPDFWSKHGKTVESWQQGSHTFYRISGPMVPQLMINQFVYFEAPGETALYARVTEIRGKTAVLRTLKDFNHRKMRSGV